MEPLKPGDTLARYRLERPLGAGGMGSVWLAVQEGLGRRVALKVMHPAIALDVSLAARFRQEAEVAASFNHPGIVPVTDFGVDEGRPFLVMDFLEGESLDAILAREAPLPAERVAFFAIQVLAALEAMHARNIVHRDLKPDNIFVSASSGVPDIARLLDFGIARVVERDGDSKMTTTGQILGTPAYMSPEQAKGMPVTPSSDLYALGVVMYESLSGRAPYEAENYHQLLFTIVEGNAPKLSELCPGVDDDFLHLIERAMAPKASERFQNATEMREALAPFAAMGVLRPSSSRLAGASPPQKQSDTDPLAATMTPQQVTPLAFDATMAPDSLQDLSASGAGPAAGSMHPEPSRRPWIALAALFALGTVGALVFSALQQPDVEEVMVATAPEPLAQPPARPLDPVDENAVSDEGAPESPTEAEAEAEPEATDSEEPSAPTRDETPTAMEEAPSPRPVDNTGAPPANSTGMRQSHSATPASMSTTPSTRMSTARSIIATCQQGEREMFLIRSAGEIYISGGDPSGAGMRSDFFDRLRTEQDAMARCLVGKYMNTGQDVNVTFDASGHVTGVRLQPYCPMPPEVQRCVAGIVRSIDFSDLNPTAGVARFGFSRRH